MNLAGVARIALAVVKFGVIPAGVLMRDMAGRASQFARTEAAALHQTQRLEANIFQLVIIDRRLGPMTGSA